MNWVGGSRNRLMMKDDVKKQREFFEKRKMQDRLKNLGLPLSNTPEVSTSSSMDLVTLFIVNQIAAKKENKEAPKVAVLSSGSRAASQRKRNEPLVLPMSPCSPSQLSLVESQPENSLTRKRKHVTSQGLNYTQLSPVLESAFSDNSASDYVPHSAEALSPFSTSSASSGQGLFPLQLHQQQRSETESQPAPYRAQPWGSSGLEQTRFQPFSRPRGMTNSMPWSYPSNLNHLETPSAAQVLFGRSSPLETEGRAHVNPVVRASLNQADDTVLDFSLNQSEFEEPFEEEVFRGFINEEYRELSCVEGSVKSKIHLKDDTPVQLSKPQTVPDAQCRANELPSCSNTSFSCPEDNSVLLDHCENSPRCFSSDSSDDEEECSAKPCLQSASSNMDQNCAETKQSSHQSSKETHPSPHVDPRLKIRDQTVTCADSKSEQTDNNSAPPCVQPQTQCRCWTTQKHEMGTQTVNNFTTETSDAATQCSLSPEAETKAPVLSLYCPPVEASMLRSATRRQTEHTDAQERNGQRPSPGFTEEEEIHQNWNNGDPLKPGDSLLCESSGNTHKINKHNHVPFISRKSCALVLDEGKQSGERWQQGNVPLMKSLIDDVKKVPRTNVSSNDAQTLQEIADILLLLKQRNET